MLAESFASEDLPTSLSLFLLLLQIQRLVVDGTLYVLIIYCGLQS